MAFQQVLRVMASDRKLDLDGDLLNAEAVGAANLGQTESVARSLS